MLSFNIFEQFASAPPTLPLEAEGEMQGPLAKGISHTTEQVESASQKYSPVPLSFKLFFRVLLLANVFSVFWLLVLHTSYPRISKSAVKFNVGGIHYDVAHETLLAKPGTLLTTLAAHYHREPIFIDRDGERFKYILDWYRNDRIILPRGVIEENIREDALFLGLPFDIEIVSAHTLIDIYTAKTELLVRLRETSKLSLLRAFTSGVYEDLILLLLDKNCPCVDMPIKSRSLYHTLESLYNDPMDVIVADITKLMWDDLIAGGGLLLSTEDVPQPPFSPHLSFLFNSNDIRVCNLVYKPY